MARAVLKQAAKRPETVMDRLDPPAPHIRSALLLKASVFGAIVSIISCGCGATTSGGAKGVGESTTTAVVLSLVFIFVSDFVLSFIFLNGTSGDALARVVA